MACRFCAFSTILTCLLIFSNGDAYAGLIAKWQSSGGWIPGPLCNVSKYATIPLTQVAARPSSSANIVFSSMGHSVIFELSCREAKAAVYDANIACLSTTDIYP